MPLRKERLFCRLRYAEHGNLRHILAGVIFLHRARFSNCNWDIFYFSGMLALQLDHINVPIVTTTHCIQFDAIHGNAVRFVPYKAELVRQSSEENLASAGIHTIHTDGIQAKCFLGKFRVFFSPFSANAIFSTSGLLM